MMNLYASIKGLEGSRNDLIRCEFCGVCTQQISTQLMGAFSQRQPSPTANIDSTVINTDATWPCWFFLRHPNVCTNARGHFEHAGKRAENEVGGHSVPPPLTNFLWKGPEMHCTVSRLYTCTTSIALWFGLCVFLKAARSCCFFPFLYIYLMGFF